MRVFCYILCRFIDIDFLLCRVYNITRNLHKTKKKGTRDGKAKNNKKDSFKLL